MEKVILNGNKRVDVSKSATNTLRKQGKIPGVIYSRHIKPISIAVMEGPLNSLVFTPKTHLISLNIEGGEPLDCIIKDVQFDPVTDRVVHFDLQAFDVTEKIQIEIPVQLSGSAIGVKEGGIVQHTLHKLDIECLPSAIPEHITIDITDMKLGDSVHVSDLKLENIEILNPEDTIIVSVAHPKVEKEPVAAEVTGEESVEPEVIGKGKSEDNKEE